MSAIQFQGFLIDAYRKICAYKLIRLLSMGLEMRIKVILHINTCERTPHLTLTPDMVYHQHRLLWPVAKPFMPRANLMTAVNCFLSPTEVVGIPLRKPIKHINKP